METFGHANFGISGEKFDVAYWHFFDMRGKQKSNSYRGEQDFHGTESFIVRHCVHGVYERFALHFYDISSEEPNSRQF